LRCWWCVVIAAALTANWVIDSKIKAIYVITPKTVPTPGTEVACDRMSGKTCELDVSVEVKGDVCIAKATSYVKLGEKNDVNKIQWNLPGGYKSCPRAGDGAFFASVADPNDDQFDLDVRGKCGTKIIWNRKDKDNNDYAYILRFRNDGGTIQCISDPWFKNG
jgi:hypothetical protein